jgi:hypothetical protein
MCASYLHNIQCLECHEEALPCTTEPPINWRHQHGAYRDCPYRWKCATELTADSYLVSCSSTKSVIGFCGECLSKEEEVRALEELLAKYKQSAVDSKWHRHVADCDKAEAQAKVRCFGSSSSSGG